jgi:hypothetical protein
VRASAAVTPSFGAKPPSVGLPLAFILTGLFALCAGVIWLVARPDLLAAYHYNQYVIAETHLFVLGWICSVVMGAMYQLVPVALETKLYSETLARWHFILHCIGFIGMVWMFHNWNMKQVGHFGSVLGLGIGLFVYNLAQTLRWVPKWNVTATAVTAALGWISLAILAGLAIATAKSLNDADSLSSPVGVTAPLVHGLRSVAVFAARFDPISAMHAHAHLGALGCFIMLIIGVSYKVIPMFTLSEVQSRTRAVCSVALLNLGLACSFLAVVLRWRWKLACALVVITALALYGWELAAIVRRRKRRTIDWGIKYFLSAVALLLPLSILAVVLSWPGLPLNPLTGQLEILYGFLGLIGVISFAIIGMLYKIIPFLVWFKSYCRQVGRAQVPALAEMYSTRWQAIGYWSYLGGLAISSGGIVSSSQTLIRWGSLSLGLSLAALLLNVAFMLTHFFRPKLKPLSPQTSVPLKFA